MVINEICKYLRHPTIFCKGMKYIKAWFCKKLCLLVKLLFCVLDEN
jgi:hypothetical protein